MGHTLFAHTSYEPSSYTSRKDVGSGRVSMVTAETHRGTGRDTAPPRCASFPSYPTRDKRDSPGAPFAFRRKGYQCEIFR